MNSVLLVPGASWPWISELLSYTKLQKLSHRTVLRAMVAPSQEFWGLPATGWGAHRAPYQEHL